MICRKKLKYLIGLLAALIMVMAIGMTAFAQPVDSDEYKLEVKASVYGHDVTLSWAPVDGVDHYRVYDMFGQELTEELIKTPENSLSEEEMEPITYVVEDLECSTSSYKFIVKGFVMEEKQVAPENPDDQLPPENPGEGDQTTPGEGDQTTPGEGDQTTPGEGDQTTPGEGDYTTPGGDSASGAGEEIVLLDAGNASGTGGSDAEPETEWVETEVCAADVIADVWIYLETPIVTDCRFTATDKVNVSWKAVENAISYNVYRRAGNGSWVYVATVSDTSYIDEAVKLGTNYSYRVRAVSNCCKNLSEYNANLVSAFQVKATAITSVSAPSSSGIQVKWNAVEGAAGYHVYAQIEGGSWKKITSTGSTTYTYALDKSYWGKKVYFYVCAYCDEYEAPASATKNTIFQPIAPTLKSATAVSAKKNTITWNKVAGVTGYKVFRKTGSSSWTCIKTISNGSTTSYSDADIKIGTTYTYTVAGYWQSGSKTEQGYYNTTGLTVKPIVTIKYQTVKDSASIMDGKKLKLYCDANGKPLQNAEEYVSASKYYLYVNKDKQYITAYVKEDGYYVPVRAMICSTGKVMGDTPNGTFSITQKIKTHELNGPCWGWYCSRFLTHHLFHSVPYKWNEKDYSDNKRLNVSYYNKLGSRASQGCIRLTTGDAKWIYDKCKVGTTVIVHQKKGYEPLEKPTAYKLDKSHNWDPTSPWGKEKCRERGCHDV